MCVALRLKEYCASAGTAQYCTLYQAAASQVDLSLHALLGALTRAI